MTGETTGTAENSEKVGKRTADVVLSKAEGLTRINAEERSITN
jgi:hypothetical protein